MTGNVQLASGREDALRQLEAHSGEGEDLADLMTDGYFPSFFANGNIKGDTKLHDAVRSADSKSINALLKDRHFSKRKNFNKALCRKRNEFVNTALHEAVMKGYVEGVQLLFSADRAVAHYPNKECKSPLYLAIDNRNKQIVDILFPSVSSFLCEHIWRQQEQSLSAATESTLDKSETIIKGLKNEDRKKGEPKAEERRRQADLILQLENYKAKEIFTLEIHKAIKEQNVFNFASKLERRCIEEEICLSDIVNGVSPNGDTLLHIAANYESQEIVQLIANHFPRLIIRRNIIGDTALHVAARTQNLHNMIILLTCYAKHRESGIYKGEEELALCRTKNEYGNTALHEAVRLGYVEGASLLLSADRVVAHFLNKECKSPLYLAVENENKQLVDALLYASFEKVESHQGNSPLHAAILRRRSVGLMKKLLDKRPELVHLTDQKGGSPLHCAAWIGDVEAARTILEARPLIALESNKKGYLPIHVACRKDHVNVVKEIVEQKWLDPLALLNLKGQNILHIAAKKGKSRVVSYILREEKLEKLLNEKDKNGNTPLHLAAKNLFPHVLFLLTQDKRVNPSLVNNQCMTGRDIVLPKYREKSHRGRVVLSSAILLSVGTPTSKKTYRLYRSTLPELMEYWLKDHINTIMLIAILVATVTFAAGFTLPGGFISSDDNDPKKSGMAILVKRRMFQLFTICDAVAMYSSIIATVILLWSRIGDFHSALMASIFALLLVGIALLTMSIAFMAGLHLVVVSLSWLAMAVIIIGTISISLFLFAFILLIFPYGSRNPMLRYIGHLLLRILIPLSGSFAKLSKGQKIKELEQKLQKDKHDGEETQQMGIDMPKTLQPI